MTNGTRHWDELDWMRHSLRLTQTYLDAAKVAHARKRYWATSELVSRLHSELSGMSHVLAAIKNGTEAYLSPVHQVWGRYMEQRARAEISQYANEISHEQFRQRCHELHQWRETELNRLKG